MTCLPPDRHLQSVILVFSFKLAILTCYSVCLGISKKVTKASIEQKTTRLNTCKNIRRIVNVKKDLRGRLVDRYLTGGGRWEKWKDGKVRKKKEGGLIR